MHHGKNMTHTGERRVLRIVFGADGAMAMKSNTAREVLFDGHNVTFVREVKKK